MTRLCWKVTLQEDREMTKSRLWWEVTYVDESGGGGK
jgi:hypothetical protein